MKRTYVILTLVLAVAGGAVGIRKACAGDVVPAKMPLDVAIRLDRDMAHIREANNTIQRIELEKRPFGDDADDILRQYKIDLQGFLGGAVVVDFKTGEIKRPAETVAAPAAPDMGPKATPPKAEAKKK